MSDEMQRRTDLEGTWRLVMLERQGRLGPAPQTTALLHTRGGEFAVKSGDYAWASGRVRVDAAACPRRVDFLHSLGPNHWVVQAGIYETEGEELRLRLADRDVPHEGFDGEQGLAIYTRD
jgi:uncharacterized protein (TIGR03067 family)